MFFIFPNCLFCFSRIENSMNKLVQINQYSSQYKTYYYCKTKLLSNTNFLSIFEHLIMENKIIGNIMGKNFLCPILSNHHLSCPFPLLCADRPRLAVAGVCFRKGIGIRYLVLMEWSRSVSFRLLVVTVSRLLSALYHCPLSFFVHGLCPPVIWIDMIECFRC